MLQKQHLSNGKGYVRGWVYRFMPPLVYISFSFPMTKSYQIYKEGADEIDLSGARKITKSIIGILPSSETRKKGN